MLTDVFGMNRATTAFDQSMSSGAASGSSATALAISSSVRASTSAQSVLPAGRRQSSLAENRVICFPLLAVCRAGRDDAAVLVPFAEDNDEFPPGAPDCDPGVF